jgi:hypothetical protein
LLKKSNLQKLWGLCLFRLQTYSLQKTGAWVGDHFGMCFVTTEELMAYLKEHPLTE